jgi:hypothetical protein
MGRGRVIRRSLLDLRARRARIPYIQDQRVATLGGVGNGVVVVVQNPAQRLNSNSSQSWILSEADVGLRKTASFRAPIYYRQNQFALKHFVATLWRNTHGSDRDGRASLDA